MPVKHDEVADGHDVPKLPFNWTVECIDTFTRAKDALEKATALAFPVNNAPIRLCTVASNHVLVPS